MNQSLESKIRTALNAADGVSPADRERIVSLAVDAVAPKPWTQSSTIRAGLIAAATGAIALCLEVYRFATGGMINTEVAVGGLIGLITGINAIRGRVNASQPIGKPEVQDIFG